MPEFYQSFTLKPIRNNTQTAQSLADCITNSSELAFFYYDQFKYLRKNPCFIQYCLDAETRINSNPKRLSRSLHGILTNKLSKALFITLSEQEIKNRIIQLKNLRNDHDLLKQPEYKQILNPINNAGPKSKKTLEEKTVTALNNLIDRKIGEHEISLILKSYHDAFNCNSNLSAEMQMSAFGDTFEKICSHYNNKKNYKSEQLQLIAKINKLSDKTMEEVANELNIRIEDVDFYKQGKLKSTHFTPPHPIKNPVEIQYSVGGGSNSLWLEVKRKSRYISANLQSHHNRKTWHKIDFCHDRRLLTLPHPKNFTLMVQFSSNGRKKLQSQDNPVFDLQNDFIFTLAVVQNTSISKFNEDEPTLAFDRGQREPIAVRECSDPKNNKWHDISLKRRFIGSKIDSQLIYEFRKLAKEYKQSDRLLDVIRTQNKPINEIKELANLNTDSYNELFQHVYKESEVLYKKCTDFVDNNFKSIRNVYYRKEIIKSLAGIRRSYDNRPFISGDKIVLPRYKAEIPKKTWKKYNDIENDNQKQTANYIAQLTKRRGISQVVIEDMSGNKAGSSKQINRVWSNISTASMQQTIEYTTIRNDIKLKMVNPRGTSSHIDGLPALKGYVNNGKFYENAGGDMLVSMNENAELIFDKRDQRGAQNIGERGLKKRVDLFAQASYNDWVKVKEQWYSQDDGVLKRISKEEKDTIVELDIKESTMKLYPYNKVIYTRKGFEKILREVISLKTVSREGCI